MAISSSGVSYIEWKKTNKDGTYAEWKVAPAPATILQGTDYVEDVQTGGTGTYTPPAYTPPTNDGTQVPTSGAPYGYHPITGDPMTLNMGAIMVSKDGSMTAAQYKANPFPVTAENSAYYASHVPEASEQGTGTLTLGDTPTYPDGTTPSDYTNNTQLNDIVSTMQDSQNASLEQIATMIADAIGVLTPEAISELTPEDIANISSAVEQEYGEYFTNMRDRAEQDFDTAQRFAQENLQKTFQDTVSDVGEGRKRIARNFSEAMMDTQYAMANRGLTRGAARGEAENRLDLTRMEQKRDLETEGKRILRTGQQSFERQFGSMGVLGDDYPTLEPADFYTHSGGTELGTEVTAQERRLEDLGLEETTTLESEKRAREEELFNTLNPTIFT